MMRLIGFLFLAALSSLVSCQTARSWNEGCPGVYSGVRYFQDHVSWLPFDGKVVFLMDLPVSAAMDTILLPITIFLEPERPPRGFSHGCEWAARR
jgi:uncharacterized protein YceK